MRHPEPTMHCCEHCHRAIELIYCRATDEYLCEDCITVVALKYHEDNKGDDEPQQEDPR